MLNLVRATRLVVASIFASCVLPAGTASAAEAPPMTSAIAAVPSPGSPVLEGRDLRSDRPLVNLNTATSEELQTLPGIGPKKAEAILDYRSSRGGFSSVEELLNVKGIGEKTLEKLRPFVTVGSPPPKPAGD